MLKIASMMMSAATLVMAGLPAQATEATFLTTLDGTYAGQGTVKLQTSSDPIKVTCTFSSSSSAGSLSLKGRCRGLLVVSRAVGVDLKVDGDRYRGSYIAGSRTAALSGARRGNRLDFAIRWAKDVNGDRSANLTVDKIGERGLTLTTTDRDPVSGTMVVTSTIVLQRT